MVDPARAAPPEFRPHLFGKFFVLQQLAVGGMAEVCRAKVIGAAGFEKELALKRVAAQRSQDASFVKMLVNEAKLTAQLTHSNIVQIYECGVIEGTYFIAMELVHGVSMKQMTAAFSRAEVAVTPEQAVFLVLQLLQGLDYAHRKTGADGEPLRIVHCDVSPDNALVSWEGEVKVLDFGIARAATSLSNYKDGMLMGKLGYVAPEQASSEKAWDHRVDVFAAGVVLYELLTRQKPFPKATDVESLVASRKAAVPPPSTLDDRIPRDVDAIVAKALAYRPEQRYATARAFADALVDVLFPTPHSAIQDLLGQQMRSVFAGTIARQRAARAHDALVLKVLQHLFEKQQRAGPETPPAADPGQSAAITALADPEAMPLEVQKHAPRAPPRRSSTPRHGIASRRTLASAALACCIGLGAGWAGAAWLRPGVLVVTSEPSGAQVSVNGRAVDAPTPAVIEGIRPSEPISVLVSGKDRIPVTIPVPADVRKNVRRVHAELPAALGAITIESEPAGARVRIDDRPVGETPITVQGVRLDERHRVDLALAGHELDQVVILPEIDGQHVSRKLTSLRPRSPSEPR